MEHCPQLCTSPTILQNLHLKMLIHRARIPVRVADQGHDWLLDGLAATESSVAMTFPLTNVYPCTIYPCILTCADGRLTQTHSN
jgi:hypothetical protein